MRNETNEQYSHQIIGENLIRFHAFRINIRYIKTSSQYFLIKILKINYIVIQVLYLKNIR
jgi:hypothetical protein